MTRLAALLAPLLFPAAVHAAGPTDLAPLFDRARIEGRAAGVLGGEAAARMKALGMDRPVEVTVTRLHRLRDADCARLRAAFDQRGVVVPGETAPRDRHAEFELNWCPGGRPPASAEGARPLEEPGGGGAK